MTSEGKRTGCLESAGQEAQGWHLAGGRTDRSVEREREQRESSDQTPCAQGEEREQRRRAKAEPRQPDARSEEGSRRKGPRALAVRSACGPRADRGTRRGPARSPGDGRGEPGVLRLLQPQPQLRGALPVSPARRGGRPPLLLRLRRPQVLLQRAGQLLPLQAQLHVEPQVGRAGGGPGPGGDGGGQCHLGRREGARVPTTRSGRSLRKDTEPPRPGRAPQRDPLPARRGPGSPHSSGEGRAMAARGGHPLWDPRRATRLAGRDKTRRYNLRRF